MDTRVEDVRECLMKQVSELELLYSMFSVPEELYMLEGLSLDVFRGLADTSPQDAPCPEFQLRLDIHNVGFVVTFHFAKAYPDQKSLYVYLRCPASNTGITSDHISMLTSGLRDYISTLPLGEPQTLEAIQWLQANAPDLLPLSSPQHAAQNNMVPNRQSSPVEHYQAAETQKTLRFARLWLYSHHIYSTEKRKNIVALARKFQLTGFSLPGKPGAICVEGLLCDVDAFFENIKGWQWRRLTEKHRELFCIPGAHPSDNNAARKFANFEEKVFETKGKGEKHMNMSEFKQFLIEHGCEEQFFLLLGLEQKN